MKWFTRKTNRQHELGAPLVRLCSLVRASEDSLFAIDDASHLLQKLEKELEYLKKHGRIKNPIALRFILSPTNSLQDIAIDNGWGEEYVELAEKIESRL
jgi:hypothetical protein